MKVWIILDQTPYEGENFVGVFRSKELAEEMAQELGYHNCAVQEAPMFTKREQVYFWRAALTATGVTITNKMGIVYDASQAKTNRRGNEAYGRTREEALANLEKLLKRREAAEGRH